MHSLIVIFLLIVQVYCHAVWKHPIPRRQEYPCGSNGQYNDWSTEFTTLSPGKNTLVFDETVWHSGAPCRIALSMGNDDNYDDHVLLDHIPHISTGQRSEFYDKGSLIKVDVDIPDVDCPKDKKCALQLIQVMTDKFSSPCSNPSGLASSCGSSSFAYFSCANVIISGNGQLQPLYSSLDGGTSSARVPYSKESSDKWQFVNGYWIINSSLNGTGLPGSDNSDLTNKNGDPGADESAGRCVLPSLFITLSVLVFFF